jgi:hypothetical protein
MNKRTMLSIVAGIAIGFMSHALILAVTSSGTGTVGLPYALSPVELVEAAGTNSPLLLSTPEATNLPGHVEQVIPVIEITQTVIPVVEQPLATIPVAIQGPILIPIPTPTTTSMVTVDVVPAKPLMPALHYNLPAYQNCAICHIGLVYPLLHPAQVLPLHLLPTPISQRRLFPLLAQEYHQPGTTRCLIIKTVTFAISAFRQSPRRVSRQLQCLILIPMLNQPSRR